MPFTKKGQSSSGSTNKETLVAARQERFKCELCPKGFTRRKSLSLHYKRSHAKGGEMVQYKCELCNKKFPFYTLLENHINAHLSLKPFKCEICSKRFTQEGNLKRHKKLVHPSDRKIRKWKCSKCDKSYFEKGALDVHFKSVHEGVRYFCGNCTASFNFKGNLTHHQLIHKDELPFQCKKCPKKFRELGNLNSHVMRIHVGESAKRTTCNYCPKTFFTKVDLKRHLVVHTNDSPHKCAVCSKAFGQRRDLERHMRSCLQGLRTPRILKRHQNCKHNIGWNAFTCVFCNLKCTSNSNLQVHYLRHVHEKPYFCRRCGREFSSKSELKNHFRKHSIINAPR